jgi:hypothetical protein
MTRLKAIEVVQGAVKDMETFLCETKQGTAVNICDPGYSVKEFDNAVSGIEDLLVWLEGERKLEDEKENNLLPDEGNPGYAVGE